jgi:hypothetical protein
MMHSGLYLVAAVACLATAPLAAQQPATRAHQVPIAAQPASGPRLEPAFKSYQPRLAHDEAAVTTTAAANTVITVSTLGLVLLIVLLIVLLG